MLDMDGPLVVIVESIGGLVMYTNKKHQTHHLSLRTQSTMTLTDYLLGVRKIYLLKVMRLNKLTMSKSHVPKKETCKRLAELGFAMETEFYWHKEPDKKWHVTHKDLLKDTDGLRKAPLLSELLEVLPEEIEIHGFPHHPQINKRIDESGEIYYSCGYVYYDGSPRWVYDKNPAEAAAQLAIWLAENDHISFNGNSDD